MKSTAVARPEISADGGFFPLSILKDLPQHPDFSHLLEPGYFQTGLGGLHSPLYLPDMERAVDTLKEAVQAGRHIFLVGDRDVDGVTSTALLANFLRTVHVENGGARLSCRVSDDGDDYGISGNLFEELLASKADLFVLLDMGTSNGPEIDRLIKSGADVIVIDHHELHARVPDNEKCAFVNPLRLPEDRRLEHGGKIATVGLVFKLLLAYALSFTAEWNTCYYLYDGETSGETTGRKKRGGQLYRLGCHLGRAASPEEGEKLTPGEGEKLIRFKTIDVRIHQRIRFSASQIEELYSNPLNGGKTLLSLLIRARPRLEEFVREASLLVATGMIADLVPLTGENRALVRLGMGLVAGGNGKIGDSLSPGYTELIEQLKLSGDRISSRDIGWSVAPVINAAGRMGCTEVALQALTVARRGDARQAAQKLIGLNKERRERTERNDRIALKFLEENREKVEGPLIFCYHADFEPGVSGILAARLVERYGRPAVFVHPDGQLARGSIRSGGDLNVLEILDGASESFEQFGGHKFAAGFSIRYERIEELERLLIRRAREMTGGESGNREPDEFNYHVELQPHQLNGELLRELNLLEPFGPGNPEPIIRVSGVRIEKTRYLSGGRHIRFRLVREARNLDFIAWNMGPRFRMLEGGETLNLYGILEPNFFRNREGIQFRVEHVESRP